MDAIKVRGGNTLWGHVTISGAKNAALPLMAASLLTDGTLTLTNVPNIADIATLTSLLAQHGAHIDHCPADFTTAGHTGGRMSISTPTITSPIAPYDLVRKMRASVLVLGPLLARFGEARVSLPGGCAIGARPVDLHLQALEAMGAIIELDNGYVVARAPKGLQGGEFVFPFVSVGATENAMMAAVLANGVTVLRNVACEPEVEDLADCLMAMGAKIKGKGTPTLTIKGVAKLHSAEHSVICDRIEAGSFAMAVASAGGTVTLNNVKPRVLDTVISVIRQAGVQVVTEGDTMTITSAPLSAVNVVTEPYPGFPTDLQAQMMAMLLFARGVSTVEETIFENRFMHVPELARMGANITLKGRTAIIQGGHPLRGAEVMATDLRASMSLIIAGLVAQGDTQVNRVYHLDRGYDRLEQKLLAIGADIERIGADGKSSAM